MASRILFFVLIALLDIYVAGSGLVAPVDAFGSTLPSGFTETQIAAGLTNPTAMAFAPDGRLFVCLQGGQVRVIKDGMLLATPFLSVPVDSNGERGLLGIAFDPNFTTNQFVYVHYTAKTPTVHNRVSRFTASGDVAGAASELVILDLNNLSGATNHNGGAIHFGADHKLYIAVGDNANSANSQSLDNLLGKILRINADGSIPSDNPFYLQTTNENRAIWALGLRNPFTFAFQSMTGRMFINDVGQNTYEEINEGVAGSNYGWPASEGPTSNPEHTGPIYYYSHGSGPFVGCAITGGVFYNPDVAQFPPEYAGKYFFADFCGGWINQFDPQSGAVTSFAAGIPSPVDLQIDVNGSLYYLARGSGGVVYRIQHTGSQAPIITQHPQNQTVPLGQPATFSVSATGDAPLTYQWQRNGVNIARARSTSYTIKSVTANDDGALFRCIVSNSAGTAISNSASLTVTGNNSPPVATITEPTAGTLYSGGSTITYAGKATDPEDGDLLPNAFTWQVDFHHDSHIHPFIPATSGATSGSFQVPTTGETSANVWYRIHLTVTDSQGLQTNTFRDILPRIVSVTLAARPSGLQLTLDGQPFSAPVTFVGVVGMVRSIGAPSPQTINGVTYSFLSWSDGGAATHAITTPSSATTYTARYQSTTQPP